MACESWRGKERAAEDSLKSWFGWTCDEEGRDYGFKRRFYILAIMQCNMCIQ